MAAAAEAAQCGSRASRLEQPLAAACCPEPTEACLRQTCKQCGARHLQPLSGNTAELAQTVQVRQWQRITVQPSTAELPSEGGAAAASAAEEAAEGGNTQPQQAKARRQVQLMTSP